MPAQPVNLASVPGFVTEVFAAPGVAQTPDNELSCPGG